MKPAYETICYCETYKQTNFPLQRTPQKSSCAVTVSSLRAIQLLFHSFDCVDEMRDLPLSAWRTAATRAKCCVFVSFIAKSHSCRQSQQLWEAAFSVWQTRCCKMKRLQWIVVPPVSSIWPVCTRRRPSAVTFRVEVIDWLQTHGAPGLHTCAEERTTCLCGPILKHNGCLLLWETRM